jgi:predicted AlkP superfamily phosphohydrolase/phosphomutase
MLDMQDRMGRTLVIGLDGCSWNVLEPLLATGQLPHLSRLVETGSSGVLESTIPFFTGPAWASYATGCSPGTHGVYDFMLPRPGGTLAVARQSDLRRSTYYEMLGRAGQRSVIVNLPLDQDGCQGAVIVNSWLTDDERRRILPIGRRERYRRLLEAYRTFPSSSPTHRAPELDELLEIERARFDLARELFLAEEWDHFFVLFSSTDWLGHAATGLFLAGDPDAREAFLRLYRQLDAAIGWLVEHAPDATVAILSDHGQTEELHVLRVNGVLRDLGLADLRTSAAGSASPFFVDRRWQRPRATLRVPAFVARHRGSPLVRPLALAAKRALRRGLDIELMAPARGLDRETSRAFSPTDASFAIYAPGLDDAELAAVRAALQAIQLPGGAPALDAIWTHDELYGRPALDDEPALLFAPAQGVRPSAAVRDRVIDRPASAGRGCHQIDGILILAGQGVRGGLLDRTSICDLAPTLLWAAGEGVLADCDGRPLYEAFDDELVEHRLAAPIAVGAFERAPRDGDDAGEVLDRLRALGYI